MSCFFLSYLQISFHRPETNTCKNVKYLSNMTVYFDIDFHLFQWQKYVKKTVTYILVFCFFSDSFTKKSLDKRAKTSVKTESPPF